MNFEIKCGEAFLDLKGNITFHCTLCENKYNGFQEYAEHVRTQHYAATIKEEIDSFDERDNVSPTSELQNEEIFCKKEIPANINMPVTDATNDGPFASYERQLVCNEFNYKMEKPETSTKCSADIHEEVIEINPFSIIQEEADDPIPTSTKKHKCTECNYSTSLKTNLADHLRRHFGARPHACTKCPRQFYRLTELNNHSKMHSGDTASGTDKLMNNEAKAKAIRVKCPKDTPKMTMTDDGIFKCTVCNYSSKEKANMWSHIRRHSAHKPHECPDCSKSFYTRAELDTHIRIHTGEKPFLCTQCGNAFRTSSKLSAHIKRHANIRDKECTTCGMKFFNSKQLKNHMTVHSEARPHKCSVCNTCFKQRKGLKNHMKLHENKREYECQVCPERFNQKPGLISHMKSKHSIVNNTSTENM